MKVTVKRVFFDNTGLHRKGEIADVEKFDANLMEAIADEPKPKKKAVEKK